MTPIPYVIRRTGREKTVALTIEGRGKLVVTAPEGVSIDRLNGIVRHKAPWVVKRIRRVSDLPPPPLEREFVSGESLDHGQRQGRWRRRQRVAGRPWPRDPPPPRPALSSLAWGLSTRSRCAWYAIAGVGSDGGSRPLRGEILV
jgi:hypothetical protein